MWRKTFKKKTLSLFLEKLMRATKLKKNNGQIARKVNEGDKIFKKLTYLKKIMGRRAKKA